MSLTYTEELAVEYFKHILDNNGKLEYMVSFRVPFQIPKNTAKKVRGWSDIDVLAIGNEEICVVQTKSFTGTKRKELIINDISNFFKYADEYVENQNYGLNKNIRNIFIVDYTTKSVIKSLEEKGIEVMLLKDIAIELIKILEKRLGEKQRVGKEESNVTRTLLFLIDHELFKEEIYK